MVDIYESDEWWARTHEYNVISFNKYCHLKPRLNFLLFLNLKI